MHTEKEIRVQTARDEFKKVIQQGRRPYVEGSTVQDIETVFGLLEIDLYVQGAPKVVIQRNYVTNEVGEPEKVNVYVRPSTPFKLEGVESNSTFTIDVNADLYNNFILEYADWLDRYIWNSKLVSNVNELEQDLKAIIVENEIELPFDFKFQLGYDIVDISNEVITIGIKENVAMQLTQISLYDNIDLRRQNYASRVADFFKEVSKMEDFFRLDTQLTRDLELRNRKSLTSMIRRGVTRKVEFLHTGVGYFETPTTFAVVESFAISDEEVPSYEEKGFIVNDNNKPTKREEQGGKLKIASRFKLNPFAKKEAVEVDEVKLADILMA